MRFLSLPPHGHLPSFSVGLYLGQLVTWGWRHTLVVLGLMQLSVYAFACTAAARRTAFAQYVSREHVGN